ncbi:MAG: uracil-DNA glycosylase [Chloroflexi bacterium]|nr:uracil-DNA glycosylase [Chloroflexota bacterium]
MSSKSEQMRQIKDEIVNLKESPLYEYRTNSGYYPVIGQGNHDADVMFIGEAPGLNEAKTGIPFSGASGRLLDELLEMIGLDREHVYITNVVKDRPPDNRDPRRNEIDLYSPFLERQINIIEPKVIATLGRFSMEFILNLFNMPEKDQKISQLHGRLLEGQAPYGTVYVLPLFHPAVALYQRSQRTTLEEDFKALKKFVK